MTTLVGRTPPRHRMRTQLTVTMEASGYCARCDAVHRLPTTDAARSAALALRDRMQARGTIDLGGGDDELGGDRDGGEPPPADSLAVERLFERRGKMFGVLVCEVRRRLLGSVPRARPWDMRRNSPPPRTLASDARHTCDRARRRPPGRAACICR